MQPSQANLIPLRCIYKHNGRVRLCFFAALRLQRSVYAK
uniref:Uncharacterized protein n=1 Tax=Arundo donax TaxID=35708 RepID=A0A0A9G726_ARUDO